MALRTGGQAIVDSLRSEGVTHTFGLISIHTLHLYDALYEAKDSLQFIGGRHESAVAYMADGYARASGRPGVCFTSTGPGAANSVGAVGEAYHGSSPVLNITSNCERELVNSDRGALHEPKDQLGMFHSVTGWNALITQVEAMPGHIHKAFQQFLNRRPRPIELEIPTDLLSQKAKVKILSPARRVRHSEVTREGLRLQYRLSFAERQCALSRRQLCCDRATAGRQITCGLRGVCAGSRRRDPVTE